MSILIEGIQMPIAGQTIEICESDTGKRYARLTPSFDDWHKIIEVLQLSDVAPVKHGKWIEHHRNDLGSKLNNCIECSECKVWFSADDLIRRSFCPNCGAKMGEEIP